jgi:ABC-type Zn2+ transport system substrate-binding protein/surface adhesin
MSCLGQKIYKKRGMDMHLIKDENGNVMPHTHGDAHTHQHEHNGEVHTHGCEHNHTCGSNCQNSGDCKNETVALLSYMLDHNEHHAAELDQMADNLAKLGMDTAAKQIKEAVSEFQKGNLRLGLALTTVKEELKEA